MLASVSAWRLRAVARLLLARRAVARRTERAEGPQPSCRRRRVASSCGSVMSRSFAWTVNSGHVRSFPSLWWVAAKGRGLEPRAFDELGPRPPGRWVGPWGRPHTDPAVKTGNPSLPPRGAENRAVGAFRLGPGSWPQGQPPIDSTPVSGYVRPDLDISVGLVRGRGHPLIALRGQLAARSTARIRGWPSISGSSMISISSRPTSRASRRRASAEKPQ